MRLPRRMTWRHVAALMGSGIVGALSLIIALGANIHNKLEARVDALDHDFKTMHGVDNSQSIGIATIQTDVKHLVEIKEKTSRDVERVAQEVRQLERALNQRADVLDRKIDLLGANIRLYFRGGGSTQSRHTMPTMMTDLMCCPVTLLGNAELKLDVPGADYLRDRRNAETQSP